MGWRQTGSLLQALGSQAAQGMESGQEGDGQLLACLDKLNETIRMWSGVWSNELESESGLSAQKP
jgi:hypothetical protein